MVKLHALILGATGATGADLLNLLLQDDEFDSVSIFVRRGIDMQHEKLKVHLVDFDTPDSWSHLVKGDVLFSCLGTTLKAAGSKDAQYKVDYTYQYEFAKAARENDVPNYILVSSAHASPTSMIFYSKMKGQVEEAVKGLSFHSLSIFRPPMLERKNTDRTGEVIGMKVIKFFNGLGMLKSQAPMPTEVLAQAMVSAAKDNAEGVKVYEGQGIRGVDKTGNSTHRSS